MKFQIIDLPKEQWQDTSLPITYTTKQYYDVLTERRSDGFSVDIRLKELDEPYTCDPEKYDFPDKLYAEWWDGAIAKGVVIDEKLVAAIETCPESWSNRLRITELWIDTPYQKQGLGHALMETAKEQALREKRRAIILETQSCNVNAIGFYLHEGFTLIGMDTCCYSNEDIIRKEVRLELGWFPE